MKKLLVIMCLWMFAAQFNSVEGQELKPLSVGDAMPSYPFRNVLNYKSSTIKASDFPGKLVIFEFWNTGCTSCVEGWPKTLKLQEKFKDRMQVILVNKSESKKVVQEFVARRKRLLGVDMNLPMICDDPNIKTLFELNGVPAFLWVGQDGVIGALTSGRAFKEENISRWLANGPYNVEQSIPRKLWHQVNPSKPLFVDNNGGSERSDNFLWSSSLTTGVYDIAATIALSAEPEYGYYILSISSNPMLLYATAYCERNRLPSNVVADFVHLARVDWQVKDSADIVYSEFLGKFEKQRYNYQLLAGKPVTRGEIVDMMKSDLDRYFGYYARFEKRLRQSLVFRVVDQKKVDKLRTSEVSLGIPAALHDVDLYMRGATFADLIDDMENASSYFFSPYPIEDKTGIDFPIKLEAECNCNDYRSLDKALRQFGISFTLEDAMVDVLVVSEVPKSEGTR